MRERKYIYIVLFLIALSTVVLALTDDTNPNVLRGTVYHTGSGAADNLTNISVNVTSGANAGHIFNTSVDAPPVPEFNRGNGYYDTDDQVVFSSSANFIVRAENATHYGANTDSFVTGTLGGFGTGSVDIILNLSLYPIWGVNMTSNMSYLNVTASTLGQFNITVTNNGS